MAVVIRRWVRHDSMTISGYTVAKLKRLHKTIMLSSAYRMSPKGNAAALAKDPENNLFWRFNMRRLTAEEVRDSILAVSGRLNLKMGGPGIYPEIPREVLAGQSRKRKRVVIATCIVLIALGPVFFALAPSLARTDRRQRLQQGQT